MAAKNGLYVVDFRSAWARSFKWLAWGVAAAGVLTFPFTRSFGTIWLLDPMLLACFLYFFWRAGDPVLRTTPGGIVLFPSSLTIKRIPWD